MPLINCAADGGTAMDWVDIFTFLAAWMKATAAAALDPWMGVSPTVLAQADLTRLASSQRVTTVSPEQQSLLTREGRVDSSSGAADRRQTRMQRHLSTCRFPHSNSLSFSNQSDWRTGIRILFGSAFVTISLVIKRLSVGWEERRRRADWMLPVH